MSIKKLLAFTGIRSDYDLMSGLYRKIIQDRSIEMALIVSGAHLSPTYGYTVRNIENDGIPILARIETLLDANSAASRLKSASILLQNCLHTVQAYRPDLIIYAGDREEVIVGGLTGAFLKIPTVHFFGGDHAADGNVDNCIRHAASKLSSVHFVSHYTHKERLMKMGEKSERIFVIGSPALDKFINTRRINKKRLMKQMGRQDWDKYALVIFHPILGCEVNAGVYFEQILAALRAEGINAFISYPNSDAGNKDIIEVIRNHSADNQFCFYKNLGRETFINLMRHALFMIGNSSVGLVEAPIIPLPAINVGIRQQGRLAADNVLFVEQHVESIKQAISSVLSDEFQNNLKNLQSPYGDGHSVERAFGLLAELDFQKFVYKAEDPLL
jgi:GDP/UDP-N,N'-diacetylbacillosamine 2-epimerase (hydrolysing)